jgi:DNA polymerase I
MEQLQSSKNKIAILDGYNLIYRSRYASKWQKPGEHNITYNFFRSLRKLIGDLNPSKVYFVLEGSPKLRLEAAPDYKGNRVYEKDESYSRQKKEILDLLINHFPITVVKHPDYECDDIISHIACKKHPEDEVIIVSSDTDFYQMFSIHQDIHLYNPIKKKYAESPDYDYVTFKSLKGDSCDNIEGFRGIGEKRASFLAKDSKALLEFLNKEEGRIKKFNHNLFMIKFHKVENLDKITSSKSKLNEDCIYKCFTKYEFNSIIKEKPWKNFIDTFGDL